MATVEDTIESHSLGEGADQVLEQHVVDNWVELGVWERMNSLIVTIFVLSFLILRELLCQA